MAAAAVEPWNSGLSYRLYLYDCDKQSVKEIEAEYQRNVEYERIVIGERAAKGFAIEESRVEHSFFRHGGFRKTKRNFFRYVAIFLPTARRSETQE